MTDAAEVLDLLDRAQEIEIAVVRADGSLGRWTPIWVVVVDGLVFVRTWRRRETGWYGGAVRTGRVRCRLAGSDAELEFRVAQVGADHDAVAVNAAYTRKYSGPGASSVVTPDAVNATLRLRPVL